MYRTSECLPQQKILQEMFLMGLGNFVGVWVARSVRDVVPPQGRSPKCSPDTWPFTLMRSCISPAIGATAGGNIGQLSMHPNSHRDRIIIGKIESINHL